MNRLRHFAVVWLFSGLLFGATDAAEGQPNCSTRGSSMTAELAMARVAKEPGGVAATVFQKSADALKDCPGEETLWYLLLRSEELGGMSFAVTVDGIEIGDLKPASEAVAKRWPRSARIATVRARAWGTVDAAREAAALDSSYSPAQVALGAALLRAGDAEGAQKVLEHAAELERIPGGYALLARARLDTGDPEGAIAAAAKERGPRMQDAIEPGPRDQRPAREAREVMGFAHLALGHFDLAAKLLLAAAAQGSANAHRALVRAEPEFRRALERLRGSKQLSREQRSVLAEVLRRKAHSSAAPPSSGNRVAAAVVIQERAFSCGEAMSSGHRGF